MIVDASSQEIEPAYIVRRAKDSIDMFIPARICLSSNNKRHKPYRRGQAKTGADGGEVPLEGRSL